MFCRSFNFVSNFIVLIHNFENGFIVQNNKTSPSSLRDATSPIEGRLWHTEKLHRFARGSPTRGAVCEAD